MSNPYEPPAPDGRSSLFGSLSGDLIGRSIAAASLIVAVTFVAWRSPQDPSIVFCGPFWYLQIVDDSAVGVALAAFCLMGFASVVLRPRWYTAAYAVLAMFVWMGTSMYLLVLTAPD